MLFLSFMQDVELNDPGVNSLKKVKVSPPRQGNMYPDLTENFFNERPDTAMSEEVI